MELEVRAALDKFRSGDEAAAFFELLEIPGDGLIAFASSESLEILQRARTQVHQDEAAAKRFRLWLEEAIQQFEFELRR